MKNKTSKIYLLLLLGIICLSCSSESVIVKEVPNEIVLIFQDCPPDINTFRWQDGKSYGSTGILYDISYADSAMSLNST